MSTLFTAIFVGVLTVLAGIFVPAFGWLLYLGLLIAVPIFPQGIHTGSGVALPWFIALWGGALLIWSAIIYFAIKLQRRVFSHRRD